MKELQVTDLAWCVNRLPRVIRVAIKNRPGQAFVAGGYVRSRITGEKINDIDLFVPSETGGESLLQELREGLGLPDTSLFKTPNALTLKADPPIQVITRWVYDTPEQLVVSFDFTVAQAAIWYEGGQWRSLCHDDYYSDLAGKRLVYTHPQRNEDAGGSALRLLKFYQRGFRAPLVTYAGVLARMVKAVDPARIGHMTETELTEVLRSLLVEVDPSIDPEHIAH